jgi:thiol-disulfide isomerase/thioredoxin
MKLLPSLRFLLAASLFATLPLQAADLKAEFKPIQESIQKAMQAGKRTPEALAPEIKALNDFLAAHASEKSKELGEALLWKAGFYFDGLNLREEGLVVYRQVVKDYPDTDLARDAAQSLKDNEGDMAAEKVRAGLVPGVKLPDFSETDFAGKPLSLSALKGKYVLIDVWATWCHPCVADMPNVVAVYDKYHDKGLEVIGISLDDSKEKLAKFLTEKKIPWPQFFDGQGWDNKLGNLYGVRSVPTVYLLDKEGKIIATGLEGEKLIKAVDKLFEEEGKKSL